VTICLSAVCENGEAVVFATDKLLTAGYLTAEFEHPGGKAFSLGQHCVGLAAGDALCSGDVLKASAAALSQLHSPAVQQIARAVREEFLTLRKRRAEEQHLRPRGLSLNEFYQEGLIGRLPPEIAFGLDQQIQGTKLGVELMLAGLDGLGAHIYGVSDPGTVDCYDTIGYHAIGSGETHALLMIIGREHEIGNSLNKTAYLVYEAKRKAEIAPGVGRETEMGLITRAGVRALTPDELIRLDEAYNVVAAPNTKALNEAVNGLPFAEAKP
jgi:20S proteasome alpha/beta subunit